MKRNSELQRSEVIIFLMLRQFPVDWPVSLMVAVLMAVNRAVEKDTSCQKSKYENLMGI